MLSGRTVVFEVGREARRRTDCLGHRDSYEPIETAAARLSLKPNALRARCRRAQRLERGAIIAPLGGGIVAVKLGTTWRVQFPASSR
jgi:hypothetical protein